MERAGCAGGTLEWRLRSALCAPLLPSKHVFHPPPCPLFFFVILYFKRIYLFLAGAQKRVCALTFPVAGVASALEIEPKIL